MRLIANFRLLLIFIFLYFTAVMRSRLCSSIYAAQQASKQASLFAQLTHKGRLQKRPKIAGRLAKNINKTNKRIHAHSAGIQID